MIDDDYVTPPTVYFAKRILSGSELIENGAVRVENGIISAVGPKSGMRQQGDRIVNLGNQTLLPGFINLHTILEESAFRGEMYGAISSPFQYRQKINTLISHADDGMITALEQSAALAVREGIANGITTQVTHNKHLSDSFLENQPAHIISLLNTEMNSSNTQFSFAREISESINKSSITRGFTAPFLHSHSLQHLKESQRMAIKQNHLYQMFLGESSEEISAFIEHAGELYRHATEENEWPFKDEVNSPAKVAIMNSLIPRHSSILFPHYCGADELTAFQSLSATVVISPRYTQEFDLRPFPFGVALENDIRIAVCTGSPAFDNNMNLLDELFEIREQHPEIPAETLLEMITTTPARALRMQDVIGTIEVGKRAHIIGIRTEGATSSPLEDLIQGEISVEFTVIDNEELIIP